MTDEITIQAALTCQRFAPAVLVGAGSKTISQATGGTKRSSSQFQSLTNDTATQIAAGTITSTSIGFAFIKNLNDATDTKTVTIAGGAASATVLFAKLKGGDFCLLSVNQALTGSNHIWAKGSAGTIDLLIVVAEF